MTIGVVASSPDPPHDLDPVDVGQAQVEQDDVRSTDLPSAHGRLAVAGLVDPIPPCRQLSDERASRLVVVLDDQDRRSRHRARQPSCSCPSLDREIGWNGRRAGGRGRSPGRPARSAWPRPCRPSPRSGRGPPRGRSQLRSASCVDLPAPGRTCRTAWAGARSPPLVRRPRSSAERTARRTRALAAMRMRRARQACT